MTAADRAHLEGIYAGTDDPWAFRTSPYEAERFDAILRCLPGDRFAHALELGCGNGELARRLAPRTMRYTGLDAVGAALAAAARARPDGRFRQAMLPCPLPGDGGVAYDLILLSEVLYFLDADGIASLAAEIDGRAPGAAVVAVSWLGDTGHGLQGEGALAVYRAATGRAARCLHRTEQFRIDGFGSSP